MVRRRKNNGKHWKYIIQESEEPEPDFSNSIPLQEATNEQETLQNPRKEPADISLPENLDSELDTFSPLGENFSILPPSSEAETNPKEVFLAYQKYCPDLEKAHSFTQDREEACKELLSKYTLKQICVAFKAINDNPWNRGENKSHWLAGIDYCLNPVKVASYLGKAAFAQATDKYRSKGIPEHTKKAFEAARKYADLVE